VGGERRDSYAGHNLQGFSHVPYAGRVQPIELAGSGGSEMNRTAIFTFLLISLVGYLMGAIVEATFNISDWHSGARFVFATSLGVALWVAGGVVFVGGKS
jgi:uncharacterized membrane protein